MEKLYLIVWGIENKCYYSTFEKFHSLCIFVEDNRLQNFTIFHNQSENISQLVDGFKNQGAINFMLS